jgi:hypothetical protein
MVRTRLLKPVAALAFSLAILFAFQSTAAAAQVGTGVIRASGGTASTVVIPWGLYGTAIRPTVCQDTNEGPQSIYATIRLWSLSGNTWTLRLVAHQEDNTMQIYRETGPCITFKFGGVNGYRNDGQTPYYLQVEYVWYFPTGWQTVTENNGWILL